MCGPYIDKNTLSQMWNREAAAIKGYHIHIYTPSPFNGFDADLLVESLKTLFPEHIKGVYNVKVDSSNLNPNMPHTQPNIEVDITREGFAEIVQWLQVNNAGNLSILVHPDTGDDIRDHLQTPLWIGHETPLNMEFFDRLKAKREAEMKRRLERPGQVKKKPAVKP